MSIFAPIAGVPGFRTARLAEHRNVFRQGEYDSMAGFFILDGTLTRDIGNTGFETTIRPGVLLGKITTGGRFTNSILGVLTAAAAAAATTVNIGAAAATELVRRIGSSGTVRFVGPPTTSGTVATFSETFSAVNTTTGAVTTAALDAALVAGSFLCADDGSHEPVSLIAPDSYDWAVPVVDRDANSVAQVPLSRLPIRGIVETGQIIIADGGWPTNDPLRNWIVDNLNGQVSETGRGKGGGEFVFDDEYTAIT